MKKGGAERHSRVGEKLNIVTLDAAEQRQRIHRAIAHRAYGIFDDSGSMGREQEDWRQAESAVPRPLCLSHMSLDDSLWPSIGAAHF